jgi:hypothetical protein
MSFRYGGRHGDECEERGSRYCLCDGEYVDEGTISELLRAVCERLARLVTPDVPVGM